MTNYILYGYPLARQMEKWWGDHANRHSDSEWIRWVNVFSELLMLKQTEWKSQHKNQVDGVDVFGMGHAAGCSRQGALKLLGCTPEPETGSTNFTFWLGHTVEIAALATLECVGYPLEDTQQNVVLNGSIDNKVVPIMSSYSDGKISILGQKTCVSVKSAAYKMSGQQKGKWVRRGFAELPFMGVREAQPTWYMQMQCELAANPEYKQGLMVVAAKDIVKAFEKDDFLGDRGNGSLSFYTEIIKPEPEIAERAIEIYSEQYKQVMQGKAGKPMYIDKETYRYVELNKAHVRPSNIWSGPNQDLTHTFNPCGGCQLLKVCSEQD